MVDAQMGAQWSGNVLLAGLHSGRFVVIVPATVPAAVSFPPTVPMSVPVSVPRSMSVAVAVQVMVSPLTALVMDRSTVLPLPRLPEVLPLQA